MNSCISYRKVYLYSTVCLHIWKTSDLRKSVIHTHTHTRTHIYTYNVLRKLLGNMDDWADVEKYPHLNTNKAIKSHIILCF